MRVGYKKVVNNYCSLILRVMVYVMIIDLLYIVLTKHSLIPCPVLVPLGCH